MPVMDETDKDGGLARGALALTTAITNEVCKGAISLDQAQSVFRNVRLLAQDMESFAPKACAAEAADSFQTVSGAVVCHNFRAAQMEVRPFACGLSFLPTEARRALFGFCFAGLLPKWTIVRDLRHKQ